MTWVRDRGGRAGCLHQWSAWGTNNKGTRVLPAGYEWRYCRCGAEQTRKIKAATGTTRLGGKT